MLDKKDLDAIEKMFDKKFLEVEDRLDKKLGTKMDAKFEKFEEKMDSKLDARFEKFEEKINNTIDVKFESFKIEMDERMNSKFKDFKEQFSLELSDVLHDITATIDSKFSKMEEKINKRFALQDKKIDLLLEYSKDNLRKHDDYDRKFSKIDSKLLNHDLRLNSLEARSTLVM